MLRKLKRE